MHETRDRKVHHTQEETTQWTSVRAAKERANIANASTVRAKAKGSKDGQDKDKNKDKSKDSVECWNCGKRGHCSKDCWSKKDNNKSGSKGNTNPSMQRMLTILTQRNQQMLNQKLKLVDSTCVTSMPMLLKCESFNGSKLEPTQVQERRHGLRVSRTGR